MPRVETPIIVGIGAGPTAPVSITFVSSGMAGSALSPADTGIYSFPSQIGVGVVGISRVGIRTAGALVASAGSVNGWQQNFTMVAAANGDTMRGIQVNMNFTPGAFTGLAPASILISAFSTATFTSPADPVAIDIGQITGSGITTNANNAFGIRIAPPVGATNNYLIAHTTAGIFSVTSAGLGTFTGVTLVSGSVLKLGNARVPGIVAQGGTVTMQDSTGATIQVLVA